VPRLIPLCAATCLTAIVSATPAQALTVQGTLTFWDSRDFRSNNTGSQLSASSALSNRALPNAYVLLMDQDGACVDSDPGCSETDDDYLGYDFTDANGEYYWTGITDASDVYVEFAYYTAGGHYVKNSTDEQPVIRTSPVKVNALGTQTINKSATCWDEVRNTAQGRCDNSSDVFIYFPTHEDYGNLVASLEATEVRINPPAQIAYVPDSPDGYCGGDVVGAALGDHFCVSEGANNHSVSHEMGHNLHMANLGIGWEDLEGGGACVGGQGFWAATDTAEKCVTAEGYAHFVGGAVWWNPNAVGPEYRGAELEGNTDEGNGGVSQSCVSTATTPHRRRGNAARFFWDLYDSTTVGTSDSTNDTETHSFTDIDAVWTEFDPGTGNREAAESGSHGRNVEDYIFHAPWSLTTERNHNCLGSQVD
jgi:hypothetical protein